MTGGGQDDSRAVVYGDAETPPIPRPPTREP